MKPFIAAITTLLVAQSALGQDRANDMLIQQAAMDRYEQLHLACRGGAGDDPKTQAACKYRDELGQTIQSYGWCYVGGWKKCTAVTTMPATQTKAATNSWREKQTQVGAKQDCFLMSGTVSVVPIWRDNNVPLSTAHANVEKVLLETGANDSEKKSWHQLVTAIYSSRSTTSEVEKQLRPTCVRMP